MSDVTIATPSPEKTPEAQVAPTLQVVPSVESEMAAIYDKNNPARKLNGEFQSKEATTPLTEGAETSDTATTESTIPPAAEAKEPVKPAISRPQSWSSDLDDFWASLPPERQDFLSKREGDVHKKISEQGTALKAIEPFRPHLDTLSRIAVQRGFAPAEGLERLLAADSYLSRDPDAAIQWLAQAYNVDLTKFAPQIGNANPATPESPQIGQLTRQITELQRRLGETSNRVTARERQEVANREATLSSLVEEFSKGKDYWSDIENEVLAQVNAIKISQPEKSDPKTILQEAHDRAVKLNEAVTKRLNEAKDKDAAAKKEADAKSKATEAKRLASINAKSTTGATPKSSSKSMEAEMEEVFDRMQRAS